MINHLVEQDQIHRTLALDPSSSFIVQAPAGSGKTELLIQRFLTLLSHVKSPEEILAITFTKKAANEMRMRVIKALQNALINSPPESTHAKKTWDLAKNALNCDRRYQWNLIENPNQLRIQTIDSFCSYLTKQLPLLSHFGSEPDIADNPYLLYQEAVQEVLLHIEENYAWSKALIKLLQHLDNDLNKLQDLLVTLLSKRDQWLSYISLHSDEAEIKNQLVKHLSSVIHETLYNVKTIFPKENVNELIAISRFAASHLQGTDNSSEIKYCLDLTSLPGTKVKDKKIWLGFAKLLLTKSFTWRKRVDEEIGFKALKNLQNSEEILLHNDYRQRLNSLIMSLQHREDVRLALQELFYLPEPTYSANQWEILQALLQVLKIVTAQLRVTFQQQGQIDFIENAQAALTALGNDENPTDLALALDYQIKHILIDEFQDTSYTQYQLLQKLTVGWEENDGRSLFVVGDPMQSIYRFREAEVGLFIRMRQIGMHHLKLNPLTLRVNFRSNSTIVEWNNTHFQNIFPPVNDMATGSVSYSESVTHEVTLEDEETKVEVKGLINASDEIEAGYVINLIKETKEIHPEDNIAILVRSRSHLTAIIPALKKAKIPYSAIDIEPLASKQPIQDLLSLTCALSHPADRIAWLSVLRAPWCGLSLSDLLVIAGKHPHIAIIQQLENIELRKSLSHDGRERLEKILPILKAKIVEKERVDLRSWIENTWLLLGGPSYLTDFSDLDDVNAYFKLLETFGAKYSVLNVDKLKEHINQLFASAHKQSQLQIMTIHSAKGLEFDTVILPQLHKKTPYDDKALLSWMERPLNNNQTALLLAPLHGVGKNKDSIYEYIIKQQRIKADFEIDRLFYVATTRAKKRLYLFFNSTSKENNEIKIETGSFLEKIWPQFKKYKSEILIFTNNSNNANKDEINYKPRYIQRMQSSWINPIKEFSSKTLVTHKNTSGFQLKDTDSKLIGIVIHHILQKMTEIGLTWWQNQTLRNQSDYVASYLKQLGMAKQKLSQAIQLVIKALQNTLNDDRGKWILHNHDSHQSEYAITTYINGQFENLVIDRTFVDEENTLWIIDYKTTTLTHDDLENFLANEQKKYFAQMEKYYLALKNNYQGVIKLGLYFPVLPAWQEWEVNDKSMKESDIRDVECAVRI